MTVKLTISLPDELARFAEDLASASHRPKSHIFAELLRRRRNEDLLEELANGYRELAEENRRFAEEALPRAAEAWDAWAPNRHETS